MLPRALATGLLLLWFATHAWAGSYTVTTSPQEDAALQWDLDTNVNPRRVANGQPPATLAQYVNQLANLNIKPLREAQQVREIDTACTRYRALSDADKLSVRTLLGGTSPCRATPVP